LFEFKGDPAFVGKLETEYRRDERIIRFITVKLDKNAAEYSEKRRNKLNAKITKES
jgi:small subunit ribosomal protein S6